MANEMYYEIVEEKYDEKGCFVGRLVVTSADGFDSGPSVVHIGAPIPRVDEKGAAVRDKKGVQFVDYDGPSPTKEELEAAFTAYAEAHRAQAYPEAPVPPPAFAGTFTKGVVDAVTHAKVADAPDDRDPITFLRKRAPAPAQPGAADMPADTAAGRAKG